MFSLDSIILIVVTCNCLPFSWPRNWLIHVCVNSKQKEARRIYGVFQINRTSEEPKTPAFSHLFEVEFPDTYLMTSAENSVSVPPNLKNFWGSRIPPDPPTRLLPLALAIMPFPPPPSPLPPLHTSPNYGPVLPICNKFCSINTSH